MSEFNKNYYISKENIRMEYSEYISSAIISCFSLSSYKQVGKSLIAYSFEEGRINILSFQKSKINIPEKFHIDDKKLYSVDLASHSRMKGLLPVSVFDGGSNLKILEIPFQFESYKINNVGGFLNTTGDKDNFSGICSFNRVFNVRTLTTMDMNSKKLIETLKSENSDKLFSEDKKDEYSERYLSLLIKNFTNLSLGVA